MMWLVSASAVKVRFLRACVLTAFAGGLAACSTIDEGKYDFSEGWRIAKVVDIGPASMFSTPVYSDCRPSASREQLVSGTFARLSYQWMGRTRYRVTALGSDEKLITGGRVRINALNCNEPLPIKIGANR